ncbi:DUF3566 domain-containing protein [Mycolicibacterium arenosum]|uniref:DUF3566 domain-containing protein n=1 Tax=Mycolicibacterium arenosum TaxID=2952157 RepID=A0ABT1M6V1_9MYCO|nr:DUF3566 domain-containing protein [Mycolicibacterium sp. CAU 1645]MCP9274901.1 DUF3566 domain-containing protein [Mycolicibacterium sp. CAU 1645]
MTSPNDQGPARPGDGPGGTNGSNGAADVPTRSGPVGTPESGGEVPPWQRGAARSRPPQPPRATDTPADGGRVGTSAGHSPTADAARLNRFISGQGGGSTPPREAEAAPAATRAEPGRPEANRPEPSRPEPSRTSETYASELPDLSGGAPRPVTRKPTERTTPEPATRTARSSVANRTQGPVRASMQVRRFDPWSVLKVSLVLSVALFFVWMIAVAFLYLVLGGMGVWAKLNSNVGDLLTSASGSGGELVSSGTIFGGAALVGLVNIVLLTAMATCGAFIYNLTTDLVGGIEVTLADRD